MVLRQNSASLTVSSWYSLTFKPGFHYPSWRVTGFHYPSTRAVLTGAQFPLAKLMACWRVMETHQLGPWTRVLETGLHFDHIFIQALILANCTPLHRLGHCTAYIITRYTPHKVAMALLSTPCHVSPCLWLDQKVICIHVMPLTKTQLGHWVTGYLLWLEHVIGGNCDWKHICLIEAAALSNFYAAYKLSYLFTYCSLYNQLTTDLLKPQGDY